MNPRTLSASPVTIGHTAAHIAAKLATSKQSILYKLRGSNPDSARIVASNAAAAWTFEALPESLRNEIAAESARLGYPNAEQYLSVPVSTWKPARPLNQTAQEYLDKAARLMRALSPSFARLDNLTLSKTEIENLGVADYRREFGFAISARHWRRLFNRTLERDGGAEQFQRLELYIDERPARTEPGAKSAAHAELQTIIAQFKDPVAPSPDECAYFWTRAFEHFEALIEAGKQEKKTRRTLIEVLFARAPFLADTREGLRKQFTRKYDAWTVGGRLPSAVSDRRHTASGNFRAPQLSEADRDEIVGNAVLKTGGNLAATYRELRDSGRISEDVTGHYLSNPRSKSYVPKNIVQQVRTEIDLLEDNHHGPRQAKLNGAHFSRDWSTVAAGDWYQADDCTLPVYYYEPDGNGWFTLWRGQTLLMIDLRSCCILGYALLSSRNYNAFAIRTVITKVADDHGLPRKGFYFERGIWQSSKILKGVQANPALSDMETEKGLRDLGLRFIHANLPRAKPVERVLGLVQDLMEGEPGYIGRDERNDKFERVQKLKLQVESRKVNPADHFYSAEQWLARLDEIFAAYNATPQQGKMTGGLSPNEAFEKFRSVDDPQIKFDAGSRYLLAHHRRPVRVTRNGITLSFGKNISKNKFTYRNEQTGRLIGRTILAWFNPELPETLCVTDLNRENPFTVEREIIPPAVDAPDEVLAKAYGQIAAHNSHAKTYYRVLRSKFAPQFRPTRLDPKNAALGVEIEKQRGAIQAQRSQDKARANKVQNVRRNGVPVAPAVARQPARLQSAERLIELLNTPEENES